MKKWMVDGKFVALSDAEKAELTTEDLGTYVADKHQNDIEALTLKFNTNIDEKLKGKLNADELKTVKADFEGIVSKMNADSLVKFNEVVEGLKDEVKNVTTASDELKEIVNKQGIELKKNKDTLIPKVRKNVSREDQLKGLIVSALGSTQFEGFKSRGFTGSSNKMYLDNNEDGKVELKDTETKATVDMSSHTGSAMISEISDIVRDDTPTRMSHLRDIINISMTDQAQIVAGQVYDFTDALTLGAVMLAENGQAPESVFKSKENTWGLKRIANSMRISKREIKVNGLQWVINKVLAKLPDATLFVEDVQLLFGDGAGNNVQGLTKDAQAFNLANNTYIATAFASIATYDTAAQTLVTFAAAHGLKNGDNLTIANSTGATYDGTFAAVEVINSTQVIIDQDYTADANVAANWTGSSTNPFYHSIDGAQEVDVLAVSEANLEAGEYMATAHVVHPSQATQMGLLKATDENYLNIAKDANGKITGVNGLPLVQTTAMPFGKFITGDFSRNGLELREFTPLNIQFAEDVESVQKSEIVIVIEEEIIFPIYNPYWFTYGKFSTAKTQLETP